jgi:hypothetical protein
MRSIHFGLRRRLKRQRVQTLVSSWAPPQKAASRSQRLQAQVHHLYRLALAVLDAEAMAVLLPMQRGPTLPSRGHAPAYGLRAPLMSNYKGFPVCQAALIRGSREATYPASIKLRLQAPTVEC